MPGPASTVVNRSLRKSSSKGTAVRSPLKEASFQARILYSQQARTIIPTNLDGFFQSRNLDSKKLLSIKLLLYEEERNLENWPMT